jgi:hypothetical protein
MHARLERGTVKLLTRTGLDWTHKYPPIAAAVSALGARQAHLDGELCGVFPDGITSFSMIQAASDAGNAAGLVYFLFDPSRRRRCRRAAADRAQGAACCGCCSPITPPFVKANQFSQASNGALHSVTRNADRETGAIRQVPAGQPRPRRMGMARSPPRKVTRGG